jgi:membrane-bound ClpP family serine protease
MKKKLTLPRLILAIASTLLEMAAVWIIWQWLLPVWHIHWPVGALIGVLVGWLAFSVGTFIFTTNVLKKQNTTGLPSLVGMQGITVTALAPEGMIKIHGELWQARAALGEIAQDENVIVESETGLMLVVRKVT